MARFRFDEPLATPLILLKPTYSGAYGVATKTYPEPDKGILIYGTFKTYGGTEREANGLYSVENTAVVKTWFRPDIKSDCRIYVPDMDETYDILGEPEDISMRHQHMEIRLMQVKGGA